MAIVNEPCEACQSESDDSTGYCSQHGPQLIASEQTYTGFAGGRCYSATLACGCALVDETADVRAAR